MTDVEITPQADDHLEELDTEPRERVLKKLAEAQEWTDHRLEDYGLVFIVGEGQSKRPFLPYERIRLDVELVGGKTGEEPAPA